jgi:hypothetical protein
MILSTSSTSLFRANARRTLVVMLCVVGLIGAVRSAGNERASTQPTSNTAPTPLGTTTVQRLERSGVRLEERHRRALYALLRTWERREDLQNTLVLADRSPDLPALLSWSGGVDDTDQRALLDVRHDLEDVSDRIGLVSGGILRVLVASSQQQVRSRHTIDAFLWRLYEEWRRRPELAKRFTSKGVVNVRSLLWWAANITSDDPSYERLHAYSSCCYLKWLDALPTVQRN